MEDTLSRLAASAWPDFIMAAEFLCDDLSIQVRLIHVYIFAAGLLDSMQSSMM
jgi:hypothetical protein